MRRIYQYACPRYQTTTQVFMNVISIARTHHVEKTVRLAYKRAAVSLHIVAVSTSRYVTHITTLLASFCSRIRYRLIRGGRYRTDATRFSVSQAQGPNSIYNDPSRMYLIKDVVRKSYSHNSGSPCVERISPSPYRCPIRNVDRRMISS